MCNLYDLGRARRQSRDDWEAAIAAVIKESEEAVAGSTENTGLPQLKQFGIRKTDPGLVLTKEGGHPTAEVMRWGFHRSYNPAVNNARSEKLDHTWSGPWQERRRCLIPVSSFYEWNGPAGAKQTTGLSSTSRRGVILADAMAAIMGMAAAQQPRPKVANSCVWARATA